MLIPQELQLSRKASAFPSCFICTIQEIDAIHLWKK